MLNLAKSPIPKQHVDGRITKDISNHASPLLIPYNEIARMRNHEAMEMNPLNIIAPIFTTWLSCCDF